MKELKIANEGTHYDGTCISRHLLLKEIEKLDCKNVSFKVHTCEHCEECCPRHEVLMILKKNLGFE